MSEKYKLEIAMSDNGPVIELHSWVELDRWIENERSEWAWLHPQGQGTNLANIGDHVQNNLTNIYQTSKNHQVSGQELSVIAGQIAAIFNGSRGPLLPSASQIGQSVLDARELANDEGAAAAYAFAVSLITFANLSNRSQLLGVMASTYPAFEPAVRLTSRLAKERINAKASSRAFTKELKSNDEQRDAKWHEMLRRAGGIARRTLRRRRMLWTEQQSQLTLQHTAAIGDIRAVQHAFEEAMHLQAPVKYWQDKAEKHRLAEGKAVTHLFWFFPLAAIFLGLAFYLSASLILGQPVGGETKHPALYLVVSGGLAIVSTLGLWIGRILTKLYLSEHHLRNDADERAIMTTTYLALTRENAAGDADRQIILNALFRNTSDGIVKDEGPSDLNLAALLSKLGMR